MNLLPILILAIISCSEQDAPKKAPPPVVVEVLTIKKERVVVTNKFLGRVVATKSSKIRPQVTGVIKKRLFEQGRFINQGEVLYEIEPKTYEAQLESSQAELSRVQSQLKTATSLYNRYKELKRAQAISEQEYISAKNKVSEIQSAVNLAKSKISQAEVIVDDAYIKAPISGYIGKTNFTVGELVQKGQLESLAEIYNTENVYVDLSMPLSQIKSIPLNSFRDQEIEVFIQEDAAPIRGKIVSVERSLGKSTGTLTARALVKNKEGLLIPAMYVEALISNISYQNEIMIPQRAVQMTPAGQAQVWMPKDGKAKSQKIQMGKMLKKRWIVKEGLKENDKVIVSNLMKIRKAGTPIQIKKPKSE